MEKNIDFSKTYLGIELGSTRIKATVIDENFKVIASGSHNWQNRFENGYWTYSLEDIENGLQDCYKDLKNNIFSTCGTSPTTYGAIGISAMMHGYMPFDLKSNLLTPFRTWRNTTTKQAADELSKLFGFNVPQRYSIAHLYQAMLNGEEHIGKISRITTLAGYIHYLLTNRHEVGICEASGIFPIKDGAYNARYLEKFKPIAAKCGLNHNLEDILPQVRTAGQKGAYLTESGAKFLDPSGELCANIPICPPEGDAATGMVATNSVRTGTGNISAGTSVFAMLVLENELKSYHSEIDIVTTPQGAPVAMVHCNNCCGELDGWVNIFAEFADLSGHHIDKSNLYKMLYESALHGAPDCGGIIAYNFISSEPTVGVESGKPMYFRTQNSNFTLSNFIRAQLYSSIAALKYGMDILFEKEKVNATAFFAHGGLFKVKGVAQQFLADALNTPVCITENSGEGGAYGMALLASFMQTSCQLSLDDWLDNAVFCNAKTVTATPNPKNADGFNAFLRRYTDSIKSQNELSEG